jgi:6,7-dimethyl-8-ribityllumazine synthase
MQELTRQSLQLGIAVADWNSQLTTSLTQIADATMDYLNCLRQLVRENKIQKEEIPSYTIIVGEAWGALLPRTS